MKWSKDAHLTDGFRWRCHKKACRTQLSIRDGSFFSKSRLPLRALVEILYIWARGESTVIKCKTDIGISDPTITDWKNFIRDVCNEMVVVRDPCTIGGVGHTVEIDESLLSKNKYHVGRMYPQVWIFGGIDTTTKDVFIVPVLRRNADLLIPIIQRHILPGTTVISDLWSGYRRLNEFGYTHLTVNHSQNFVDPQTGANTNAIESLWSKVKYRNKKECGTSRKLLVTYLSEYKWRRKFGADAFANIVRHIRSLYVVCDFADPLPPVVIYDNVNQHVGANDLAVERALVGANFEEAENEEDVDDPAPIMNVVQGAENTSASSDSSVRNLNRAEIVPRRGRGRGRTLRGNGGRRPLSAEAGFNLGENENEEDVDDPAPIMNVVQGAENTSASSDSSVRNLNQAEVVPRRGRGRPRREPGTKRPRRRIR